MHPLQVGEPEAFAHGEHLQQRQSGLIDAGQVLGYQFVECGRRRQRPGEMPNSAVVDQNPAFSRAAHELDDHLQVAAGEFGQFVERSDRHGPVEGAVEERAELVRGERRQIEAGDVTVTLQAGQPFRRDAIASHCADHEHGA